MSRVSQLELYNDKDVITQILLMKEQVETGTYKEVRVIETGGNYVFEFINQKDEPETFTVPAKQISGVTSSQAGSTVTMRVTYNDGTYQDVSWTAGGDVTTNTAQTISAVKTFSVSPLVPNAPSGPQAAVNLWYTSRTEGTNNLVHTSANETIAGVKTFTSKAYGLMQRGVFCAVPSDADLTAGKYYMKIFEATSNIKGKLRILEGRGCFECFFNIRTTGFQWKQIVTDGALANWSFLLCIKDGVISLYVTTVLNRTGTTTAMKPVVTWEIFAENGWDAVDPVTIVYTGTPELAPAAADYDEITELRS